MNIKIENNDLLVNIRSKGAELFSIVSKGTGLEYMWSGDPAFWGKTSPVLFPIVGTLKDDKYFIDGNSHTLTRHGFARDAEFDGRQLSSDKAQFTLNSNEDSLKKYPFDFSLKITYALLAKFLVVEYSVENKGKGDMFFSLGAHPAFKVPLINGTLYEDHYLEFNKEETAPRWPISDRGLIKVEPVPFLDRTVRINLNKELFYNDAIVLKHLNSNIISIKATTHSHGLDFHFDGFPFLGLWAARNADFVCIEPWCGIADSVNHNSDFSKKEGIEKIASNASWKRMWKVRLF
jgi:galactose mutarotase-like enzyme